LIFQSSFFCSPKNVKSRFRENAEKNDAEFFDARSPQAESQQM
jgi:hypothetical protein